MARKKPATLEEVFKVMAKHDFNVKEASQELQINKSRIYNIKSRYKNEWQQLLDKHNQKEEKLMIKQPGRETIARVADKKFKPIPSVKSAMHEKHVGVTRSISGGANVTGDYNKNSNLSKDLYAENIKLDKKVKDLMKVNEEIAGALNRSNEEKEAIGKEFNLLVDDFNEAKVQIKALKALNLPEPLEVEETVYAVKLGKVFVTPDLRLYGHHSAAQFKDIVNAKQIKEEVGGTLYKSVLMPVEGDSDAKDI